ncbi:hypothetical protein RvY_06443 [Ramazzottius varieornatus]|uniref:1-acylglycerol-3-phosphate O-acyltransferase ABHD5 n=1 Tax=Ramazzottius varieornatus TaxID=947166 RepID=A0A1D1UYL8_RAMVA|nr:hypothetical protein RvY_06443 [Ramazzottius varieornatus]
MEQGSGFTGNLDEPPAPSSNAAVTRAASRWLSLSSWIPRWVPTSDEALAAAERKILSYLKTPYQSRFVTVDPDPAVKRPKPYKIWTLSMNTQHPISQTPIVLVHGFGGGVGMWIHNLDALSARRPLYAMDVLGFGQSSRPSFSSNAESAEAQFVDSIEAWRKELNLTKFILLGHSLGAFLCASYALKYPQHVRHLIMVDPWGMPELPSQKETLHRQAPFWIRTAATVMQPFNPLAGLRAAGPWGPRLVTRLRPDLQRKFIDVVEEENAIFDYIYHLNAQHPSGEAAFKTMTSGFGWAKNHMSTRMGTMERTLPVSFVYGKRSWIDHSIAYTVKDNRKESFTEVIMVEGAGHHVYADMPKEFNRIVDDICQRVDNDEIGKPL